MHHIALLIIATIVMKFVVVFFTTVGFHSFVDYFDISVYLNSVTPLLQGQIPYINYSFAYPLLTLVPILLAFIPAVLTQSGAVFALCFQILMVLCDIIIVIAVYLIGLKIHSPETAFYGGLIYATAFSTAYFIITKSDAFSTALLMLGILLTVYGIGKWGYAAASAGFFTKIFPIIALPFMICYNAKVTSFKKELTSAIKIFFIFCLVLLLPLTLLRPETLGEYLFATGSGVGVYVNTATYTLYALLSGVFYLGVTPEVIGTMMSVLMVVVLLVYLLYLFC